MTLNAVNTSNLQIANDNAAVESFSATAITVVSGGQFVYLGSQAASASSGLNSIAITDVWVAGPASGTNVPVGVVQSVVGSASPANVMYRGFQMISTAAETIVPGDIVSTVSNGALVAGSQAAVSSLELQQYVGRALTGAGSEGYCLHTVNFL
jgi:hypothetical protein